MGDKLTVVTCETNAEKGGYDVLLSNGETVPSGGAYPVGVEYAPVEAQQGGEPLGGGPDVVSKRLRDGGDTVAADTLDHQLAHNRYQQEERTRLEGDNAMLQRGLDEANGTIANLQTTVDNLRRDNGHLTAKQGEMKVPASLSNVQTRDVKDLPRLDQLQPHPEMEKKREDVDTRTDVEKHLAAKAAARDAERLIDDRARELLGGTDEGAKP